MRTYRCRVCGEVYLGEKKPASCPFCGAHENYFVPAGEWDLLRAENLSEETAKNLRKSLELEINNTLFYKAASAKSRDKVVSSMFKGLSKVEREHASAICKHLKIEKPRFDDEGEASGNDRDNIQEANRREKNAVRFYGETGSQAPEKEIREFFKALMQIESDHIILTGGI